MRIFLVFTVLAIGVASALPASAADINSVHTGSCDIRISGPIAPGDDNALANLVAAQNSDEPLVLCLDSEGGVLSTALRIAAFVYESGITTLVEQGARCESSCSIIFFMGTIHEDGIRSIRRSITPGGKVGIHRPSLIVDDSQTFQGSDITRAFEIAMEAAGQITALGQNNDERTGEDWIPFAVVNHLLNTSFVDMFVIATAGQAQEWNIQVPELDWPNTVTTEFAWNLCNFGVRARMGWSHVSAPLELGTLAETSEEVPVVLTQRFMRGQREPVVIESYDVRSAYESGPLRFGCVLDVSYPVGATSRMEVSVCVVPFLALAPRQVLLCENQNERITVSSALAGVAPDKDLSTIIRELDRITSGSIPSRDETITTLRSP